jgi:hypothetical protein
LSNFAAVSASAMRLLRRGHLNETAVKAREALAKLLRRAAVA